MGLVTIPIREGEGWWQAIASVVTMVIGVAAILGTGGAATPVAIPGMVLGTCTTAYGASNLYEAIENIHTVK